MKKWPWFILSLLLIALDQWTKHLALSDLIPYKAKAIMPMFNLTLAYNTGAAFSFLNNAGDWHHLFFIAFALIMSVVLMIWIVRADKFLQLLSLTLILSGALGNLIDRFTHGYVIDFIDIYYKHYHWPVFNIADTLVCIGAILLGICLYKEK